MRSIVPALCCRGVHERHAYAAQEFGGEVDPGPYPGDPKLIDAGFARASFTSGQGMPAAMDAPDDVGSVRSLTGAKAFSGASSASCASARRQSTIVAKPR